MSSINRLAPDHLGALKAGRAISFLSDYRSPDLPDHTYSVIGLLDTLEFHATLVDDADPDGPLESMALELGPVYAPELPLDNADARAVHALWSMWDSGVRDGFMRFLRLIGQLLGEQRLSAMLDALDAPTKATRKTRHTRKGKRP